MRPFQETVYLHTLLGELRMQDEERGIVKSQIKSFVTSVNYEC